MDECNIAMDDCMAAMVLMSLSCSPKSPIFTPESELVNESMFQCTWPGCGEIRHHCEDIERHIRVSHLGRSDSTDEESSDHEEEFYYNEIEMFPHSSSSSSASSQGFLPSSLPHKLTIANQSPLQSPGPLVESDAVPFFASSSAPTWSHLDMVRPPHEDPEYRKYIVEKVELISASAIAAGKCEPTSKCGVGFISNPINIPGTSTFAQHYARPLNLSSSSSSASSNSSRTANNSHHSHHSHHHHNNASTKYARLNGNSKCGTTLLQSPSKLSALSPTRRTRGETKKCRKMYGMDNRESWCTQCKWKKACSRFVD